MVGMLALLSGCLSYNHDKRVAVAVLSDGSGKALDERAVTGALQARFPVGSPVAAVEDFSKGLGGRCSLIREKNEVMCSVPLSGVICAVTRLVITAEVKDGAIGALRAAPIHEYC